MKRDEKPLKINNPFEKQVKIVNVHKEVFHFFYSFMPFPLGTRKYRFVAGV